MFRSLILRAGCVIALAAPAAAQLDAPYINEIMFHPSGVPENTGQEYIEIHNPTAAPVNVTGWRIDQGVSFNFPATSIPAGGFLVVAGNTAAFQARYPGVTGVVGGWTGSLSNSAEAVRIVDATGLEVDSVDYATQGDWGRRVRETQWNGWDWDNLADGGGRSLELINPLLGNNNGQNWTTGAANNGTPGQPNSVAAVDVAPLIKDVQHRPVVPAPSEPIRISCEIEDEAAGGDTATLFWRLSTANPGPFSQVVMAATPSGRMQAVLPGQVDKTVIEFYVQASDGTLTRTWPAPTSEGQNANALLQVDGEVMPVGECAVRLVLSVQENTAYQNSDNNSDREYNTTVIGEFGSGYSLRYRGGMRIRGASSRSHNPRPMRVNVPNEDKIDDRSIFNLNPKYTYLQYLGAKIFEAAGIRTPTTRPVQVRRNGVNNARFDEFDYGRWAMVEHLDGDFIDEHWPLDSGGNLYKKVRPDNSWAYRNGNVSMYLADGFTKETNGSANNWADLDNFTRVINENPTSVDYLGDIQFAVDFQQWMKWFATQTLIANGETNVSNGADDDYSIYFGEVNHRMQLIPHDLDTVLGWGDGDRIEAPNYTLFDMSEAGDRGEILEPLIPLMGTTDDPGAQGVKTAYFTALRDLAATFLEPVSFGLFVDSHLGGWVAPQRIAAIKDFMSARRTFVLNAVTPTVGPYVPQVPTSLGSLAAPRTAPVVLNEILAQNVAAHLVDGAYPDVIELYNYGASPVDLSDKSLTDDPTIPTQFVFPPGTTIAPGNYLIVFGGTAPAGSSNLYAGFALGQEGDTVYFYDSATSGGALIDSVTFGPQAADWSIGRTGAAGDVWQLGGPTIGAANVIQSTGPVTEVRINEWLANPDFRVEFDFIELYNPLSAPVAIGGVKLTDDAINFPGRHALPALSFIGPQGFAVLSLTGGDGVPANPSELPFKLSAVSGWATLTGANNALIDRVDMDCTVRDVSTGRTPDGTTGLADFEIPSPGLPNAAPPAALVALLDNLRITEINYNPVGGNDYEFIELYNIGDAPLDLTGVRLSEGIQFVFPAYTLAPGAYVAVVRNQTVFESRYGAGRAVAGVFSGALDNSGETISLTLPNPWDVNILSFRYERDWYPATDGGGHTLEIVSAGLFAPRDWSDRDSWLAGGLLHGTPGMASPPVITSALTGAGTVGAPFSYTIAATNDPTQFAATSLPPGLTVNTSNGLISGTPTADGVFNVAIEASTGGGSDQRTLVLTIAPEPPPLITSPLTAGGLVNGAFTYQIVATNFPDSYSATGRPAWLNFNDATGLLSGTPPTAESFDVTIGATNGAGTDTKVLAIQIVSDVIGAAVDSNELLFTRGGNTNWFSQNVNTFDGIDAAQSGAIADNQQSWIETTVTGARHISFWWSVSSHVFNNQFNDSLEFRVDGNLVTQIYGDVPWRQEHFEIPTGTHTLRWRYRKNGFLTAGEDAGWVDRIRLSDPDSDGDGMSDPWETATFGTGARDGTGDFDGDGQTDLSEFLAGTSPVSPTSIFAVRSIDSDGNGQFTVMWDSVPGRVYQCQASPDLRVWLNVGPPTTAFDTTTSLSGTPPTDATQQVLILAPVAPAKALIPTGDIGTLWRGGNEPAFAAAGGDTAWLSGTTGVGYEANPGDPINYIPYLGFDLIAARNVTPSVFCRVPFTVDDPAALVGLTLFMRCDDGFAAWINGVRMPSLRSPDEPTWNAAATGLASDDTAILFDDYPLPEPFDYLRPGQNILAIQAMNDQPGSSDLLAQPAIVGELPLSFAPGVVFWRVVAAPSEE